MKTTAVVLVLTSVAYMSFMRFFLKEPHPNLPKVLSVPMALLFLATPLILFGAVVLFVVGLFV